MSSEGTTSTTTERPAQSFSTSAVVKSILGGTSLVTLLLGVRSAWKHSRQPEAAELAKAQIYSGVAFAGKALTVATVITVSGFALLTVGVSALLDVNTPKEFGAAVKDSFGDSLRLPQSKNSQSFEEFLLSVEKKTGQAVKVEESSFNMWELVLGLVLVLLLFISVRRRRPLPLDPASTVLLVIAHPDDETMFFAPTIRALTAAGHRTFVLCISTGDFYGLGQIRKPELRRAAVELGLSQSDVTILDHHAFRDGSMWDARRLGDLIMQHTETLSINTIVTFDAHGVSGHHNHTACFNAVQHAYTHSHVPEHVQIFVLDSVSVCRKYLGLWDSVFSCNQSPFCYVARLRDVGACWRAMRAHYTQLVWFRRLYIVFSRYVYMNNLRRIAPIDLIAAKFNKSKTE